MGSIGIIGYMLGTPTSILFVDLENSHLQMYLCVHRGYMKLREVFGSPSNKDLNV